MTSHLRHCHTCGRIYAPHSKWCPSCFGPSGQRLTQPMSHIPQSPYPLGTRVILGAVYHNCQPLAGRAGVVVGVSPLNTCNIVNVEGIGEMPIYMRYLTPQEPPCQPQLS